MSSDKRELLKQRVKLFELVRRHGLKDALKSIVNDSFPEQESTTERTANTFKSCAICKHCDIGLGYDGGKSDYPTAGHFDCSWGHKLPGRHVDLVDQLRVLAKNCPDFELMDDPE